MSERPAAAGSAGRTRIGTTLVGGTLAALTLAACSTGGKEPPARALAPTDFQRPAAPTAAAGADAPAPAPAPPRPLKPIRMIAMSEALEGVLDVSTTPGAPPADDAVPAETTDAAIVLDSKVGEINGRPIFASAFLQPLDGRLRAAAEQAGGDIRRWNAAAVDIIGNALERELNDELLLAEAHASMPKDQKEYGLRAFMQQFRGDMARRSEGSLEQADERLRQQEGLSLDEKTRQALDKALIESHLSSRIYPRVHVSARDQRDYYEKNYDEFNPPAKATLRLIRVSASDEPAVAAVGTALESGTPFAEVAASAANRYLPDEGGRLTVTIKGAYEDTTFVNIEPLNAAARTLKPGERAGPIPVDSSVWWITLESLDQPPQVSFYEAQLEISRRLIRQRSLAEESRYLDQLKSKGSFTDLTQTTQRLFDIATARYFGR